MKKLLIVSVAAIALLAACQDKEPAKGNKTNSEEVKTESAATENTSKEQLTKGQEMANILSGTNWQGTKVYDRDNNDLTAENANFIGLAKYDAQTGHYEFFDAATGKSRDDKGTFFITNDGKQRILISESKNYQAVVEITELNDSIFTYKRMGKDAAGNDVEIFVEHIPYKEKELAFTDSDKTLDASTGEIATDVD